MQRPRRNLSRSLVSLVLLILLIGGSILLEQPNGAVPGDDGQEILGAVRVGDGDSLDIGRTRIRLHGIDAVELAQHCKDAAGADYACGEDAKRTLEDLVRGKAVRCDERHGVDQYGRIAAVCTADGIDLNAAMVDSGFALAYRQHSLAYVPNEDKVVIYVAARDHEAFTVQCPLIVKDPPGLKICNRHRRAAINRLPPQILDTSAV